MWGYLPRENFLKKDLTNRQCWCMVNVEAIWNMKRNDGKGEVIVRSAVRLSNIAHPIIT